MLTSRNPQESEEHEDKRMKSPDMSSGTQTKTQLTEEQLEKPFYKLELSGIEDWNKEEQEEV